MRVTFGSASATFALSDGRLFDLPQVMSGSGIRYAATVAGKQEEFVSEGDKGMLNENGNPTFNQCVSGNVVMNGGGLATFTDNGNTFSFMFPSLVTLSGGDIGYSQDWQVNSTSSGMLLVKATLPGSFEPKTTFDESNFTVGTSADPDAVASCTDAVNGEQASGTAMIGGVNWTRLYLDEGAAGSFYHTTSYHTVKNNQCYVIEYTVHEADIGDFDPSQGIKMLDEQKVDDVMDGMVKSFMFKG